MAQFKKMSFVFVFWLLHQVTSVQITNLFVPKEAVHETIIDCKYQLLEGEAFYDVKWYKDDRQFLRCTAAGDVVHYAVEGVQVYHSPYASIGSCPVKLVGLTGKSSGDYKCEVSLDAPSFHIATDAKYMKVLMISARRDPKDRDYEEVNAIDEGARDASGCRKLKMSEIILLFLFNVIYYNL